MSDRKPQPSTANFVSGLKNAMCPWHSGICEHLLLSTFAFRLEKLLPPRLQLLFLWQLQNCLAFGYSFVIE